MNIEPPSVNWQSSVLKMLRRSKVYGENTEPLIRQDEAEAAVP
jgi:hypothetical protein